MINLAVVVWSLNTTLFAVLPDCATYFPLNVGDTLRYRQRHWSYPDSPNSAETLFVIRTIDSTVLRNDTLFYYQNEFEDEGSGNLKFRYRDTLYIDGNVVRNMRTGTYAKGLLSFDSSALAAFKKDLPGGTIEFLRSIYVDWPYGNAPSRSIDSCYTIYYSWNHPSLSVTYARGIGIVDYYYSAPMSSDALIIAGIATKCPLPPMREVPVVNFGPHMPPIAAQLNSSFYDIQGRLVGTKASYRNGNAMIIAIGHGRTVLLHPFSGL
jgi:hypothetical protein